MDVGELIYTVVELLIAASCCLGNMLVILALWTSKCIHQPTYCLIVSLAVADFMVGCVAFTVGCGGGRASEHFIPHLSLHQFVDVIPMSYLVYFNVFLCILTPLLVMTVLYGCVFSNIQRSLRQKTGNGAQKQSLNYLCDARALAVSPQKCPHLLFFCMWLLSAFPSYQSPG